MAEDFVRLAVNRRVQLGRYLLLFPYEVKGREFRRTALFTIASWAMAIIFPGVTIYSYGLIKKTLVSNTFLFLFPVVFSSAAVSFNLVWLHFHKSTLDNVLSRLRECRPYLEVDDNHDIANSYLHTIVQLLSYLCNCVILVRIFRDINAYLFLTILEMNMFVCVVFLEQFILILSLLCKQISKTSPMSDGFQDAVRESAVNLNIVFSPHLLLMISALFVFHLSKMFRLISFLPEIKVLFLVVTALQWVPIFRTVSKCEQFAGQMEQFYNRMYYIVLKQPNPQFQKKLELHLRMRRKFAFTAGGMFDVDYKLMHSMVATLTTYLVVLYQFNSESKITKTDTFTVPPK